MLYHSSTRGRHMRALIAVPFAATLTLALAGCGGGGGGGGGGSSSGGGTAASIVDNINTAALSTAGTQARIAARAVPKEGSVTQSSNVSGGVTTDQIDATATYTGGALRVSVTNSRSGSWGTVDSDSDITVRSNTLAGDVIGIVPERALGKRLDTDDGTVFVDVYTTRLSAADTDYLIGGVWLVVPDDASSVADLEIGAFTDATFTPTPAAYLRTAATASYRGDATGLFTSNTAEFGQYLGEFAADVELTAAFSATPTVSGRVHNFVELDANRLEIDFSASDAVLTLGAADIANTPGGFFTGDTSATYLGSTYTGKWGGQFYGSQADYAAGTFGASTSSAGLDFSFVGAYGAVKQ